MTIVQHRDPEADGDNGEGARFSWLHPEVQADDDTRILYLDDPANLQSTVLIPTVNNFRRPPRVHDGEQTVNLARVMHEAPDANYRVPVMYDGRLKPRGPHKDRLANSFVTGALLALTAVAAILAICWSGWVSRETALLGLAAAIFAAGLIVSLRRKAIAWHWVRRTLSIFAIFLGVAALGLGVFLTISEHILVWLDVQGILPR